jgi:FkbM family methyltransferase
MNKNILDVGSNIGFYALQIAQHIKNSKGSEKIFAFEPHSINHLNLKYNIKINKLTNYIYPFNFALSDKKKNLNFNKLFLNLKKNKYNFYDINENQITDLNKLDLITDIYASK